MNEILEMLLKACNSIGVTIMRFSITEIETECPYAIIEDSEGRLTKIYYEDDCWG